MPELVLRRSEPREGRRTLVSVRTPMTIDVDDRLRRAVERAAREDGVDEARLVEDALRRYVGLRGLALLDDVAARQEGELSDDEAMALAVEELRAARAERRQANIG